MKTLDELIEEAKKELSTLNAPKRFCGRDHCSGLSNLLCDDIDHPDSLEKVKVWKVRDFLADKMRSSYKLGRDEKGDSDIVKISRDFFK